MGPRLFAMRCENCGIVSLNLDYPDQNDGDKLIDILTLCSSKELRDDLQKSNPDIDINSEIIKNWKENYLPDDPDFKNQFKNYEKDIWFNARGCADLVHRVRFKFIGY